MMLELSAQAQHRRNTIRAHVLDQVPAIAHRRKRRRRSKLALAIAALFPLGALLLLWRTTPPLSIPSAPVVTVVTVVTVGTDPAIVERLAFHPQSIPQLQELTDQQLLEELAALGIQTGLVKSKGKTSLTVDVVASHAPTDQTTES